ncbi:MAG: Stp1/IreP family PP2C-type Ser/Thr phosphatase [Myxococcota bacterium]
MNFPSRIDSAPDESPECTKIKIRFNRSTTLGPHARRTPPHSNEGCVLPRSAARAPQRGEPSSVQAMTAAATQNIDSASLTSIGQVRSTNQDYFGEFSRPDGTRLLLVADGMGGHRGGATASRLATETIGEVFATSTANAPEILYEAIRAANARVHQASLEDPELRGMGTTVVTMLFDAEGLVWVAHVGDSRAYRLHRAGIEQITQDHSVVAEMVRRGLITAEEAEVHPRRNEILRSVGVESAVEIDVAQVLSAPGDVYVLCSDGLSGEVSDVEIAQTVQSAPPETAARVLVALANDRGAPDNVTVQIALLPMEDGKTIPIDIPLPPQPMRTPRASTWIAGLVAALVVAAAGYYLLQSNASSPTNSPTNNTLPPLP